MQQQKEQPITICISGAGGKIAYAFIPLLLTGNVFKKRLINLRLLGTSNNINVLKGITLQIHDCAYHLLNQVKYGDNPNEMFQNADVVIFLASAQSKPTMQRKDLLPLNKQIFIQQAKSLDNAKQNVKCVVVSNPSNTSAFILSHYNPKINKKNITCLSRLDHNRARNQISQKLNSKYHEVENIMIFGNHSLTQYPCIEHIKVKGTQIKELVEKQWLETSFLQKVQKRGHEILQSRGVFPVFSAASALVDHLRDWCYGTDKIVSMGVVSDGSYGIPVGIWSSFPVKCQNFNYQIVSGLKLSQLCIQKIKNSVNQLQLQINAAQLKNS